MLCCISSRLTVASSLAAKFDAGLAVIDASALPRKNRTELLNSFAATAKRRVSETSEAMDKTQTMMTQYRATGRPSQEVRRVMTPRPWLRTDRCVCVEAPHTIRLKCW